MVYKIRAPTFNDNWISPRRSYPAHFAAPVFEAFYFWYGSGFFCFRQVYAGIWQLNMEPENQRVCCMYERSWRTARNRSPLFYPKTNNKNLRKEKNPAPGMHKTGTAEPLEFMACVLQRLWRNGRIRRFGGLGFVIIYGIFCKRDWHFEDSGDCPGSRTWSMGRDQLTGGLWQW